MRTSHWVVIAVVGVLLLGGLAVVIGTQTRVGGEIATGGKAEAAPAPKTPLPQAQPGTIQEAQVRQPAPAAPAPAAAPAPSQPAGPRRVETTMYDSWAVTCEDTTVGTAAKRTCSADLRVLNQNRAMVLSWQIGFNPDGRLTTAIHIPAGLAVKRDDKTIGGAILVGEGLALKFGNGPARRLNFVSCGPKQCVAESPIDDAFIKEASANATATVTISTTGGAIPFDLPIKGIDKAIASARR